MKKTILTSLTCLSLVGCTTVGQQITNSNGTVVVKQVTAEPQQVVKPVPVQKAPPKVVTKYVPVPVVCNPAPVVEVEYSYTSRRVVDSYLVVW